jgi:hypothetical protein
VRSAEGPAPQDCRASVYGVALWQQCVDVCWLR